MKAKIVWIEIAGWDEDGELRSVPLNGEARLRTEDPYDPNYKKYVLLELDDE